MMRGTDETFGYDEDSIKTAEADDVKSKVEAKKIQGPPLVRNQPGGGGFQYDPTFNVTLFVDGKEIPIKAQIEEELKPTVP